MALRPCRDFTKLERSDISASGVTGFSSTILVFPLSSAAELDVDDVVNVPVEELLSGAVGEVDVASPFPCLGLPSFLTFALGAAIFEIFSLFVGEPEESLFFG